MCVCVELSIYKQPNGHHFSSHRLRPKYASAMPEHKHTVRHSVLSFKIQAVTEGWEMRYRPRHHWPHLSATHNTGLKSNGNSNWLEGYIFLVLLGIDWFHKTVQAGDIDKFRENLTFWHSMNCFFLSQIKNDPNVCTFHGKPFSSLAIQDGDLQNLGVRHWFDSCRCFWNQNSTYKINYFFTLRIVFCGYLSYYWTHFGRFWCELSVTLWVM